MKNGHSRFEFHLTKIDYLLKKADEYDNPALWLYYYELRSPLFMIEGLARIYAKSHNPKFFTKLKKEVKILEDSLGEIDYYYNLFTDFNSNSKVPKEISSDFEVKLNEKITNLNRILVKEKWMSGKKLSEIRAQLLKLKWKGEKQDIKSLKKAYKEQAFILHEVISDPKFMLNDIEFDVHEYRRKLRWLSIYPNALCGAAKLVVEKPVNKKIEALITPEVVNSPYVKIRSSNALSYHIELNKSNFLALSWAISELGVLKDKGLNIESLTQAYMNVYGIEEKDALLKVYAILGTQYPNIEDILRKATLVTYKIASNRVLTNLFI